MYGQAADPGQRAEHLVTVTKVLRVHELAMTLAWDVAPHPDAGQRVGPGGFRAHDTRPFARGIKPPSWTDVPAQLRTWTDHVTFVEHQIAGSETEPGSTCAVRR